jgi:hypothetical protein
MEKGTVPTFLALIDVLVTPCLYNLRFKRGSEMTNGPATDRRLLLRLKSAAKHEMTTEELRRQRVSFVFGNLPENSPMTKHQVELALAKLDGEAA